MATAILTVTRLVGPGTGRRWTLTCLHGTLWHDEGAYPSSRETMARLLVFEHDAQYEGPCGHALLERHLPN